MTILDQGGNRRNSRGSQAKNSDSDIRSSRTNRALISNPLYGHKIKHLTSTDSSTVILRIKNYAFMEFVHPDFVDFWHDREQSIKFPEQIRLESSTKKIKEKYFSNFSLKKFESGEVILKAGTLPSHVYFVVKGNIDVRSET